MTRSTLLLAMMFVIPALLGAAGGWIARLSAVVQERDELPRPEETEVWEPEPAVVKPGGARQGAVRRRRPVRREGPLEVDRSQRQGGAGPWRTGAMTVEPGTGSISTRDGFGDVQLHIEWRTPTEIVGARDRAAGTAACS